jgi:hypothetical protein
MNILTAFFAWRDRRRAERELIAAERARNALMRQIHTRKQKHHAHRPMLGLLQEATKASLRASVGRRV